MDDCTDLVLTGKRTNEQDSDDDEQISNKNNNDNKTAKNRVPVELGGGDGGESDDGSNNAIVEQYCIFDHKSTPQPGRWYILPSSGHTPLARVGHAAVYIPNSAPNCNGSVVSAGGANPDGTFSEVNILDLNTLRWDLLIPPGLRPRYEHSAFCLPNTTFNSSNGSNTDSAPAKIYIFAGADQVENMNDIQVIDLKNRTASTISDATGSAPGARTFRCHSALGGQLFVYGGGRQASDPVSDKQTRVYDSSTNSWSSVDAKGQTPKSRQGHSCVALSYANNKRCLVVHGGMAGNSLYDDVHILDLDSLSWSEVKLPKSKPRPSPRAAHIALPYKGKMVVFGGLARDNVALNDLWLFDVAERQWQQVAIEGAAPPARLDAAACIVTSLTPVNGGGVAGDYLLVSGGMDTEGDVFSDCFIFRLDTLVDNSSAS